METSHSGDIDTVVRLVRSDEPDIADAVAVVDGDDHAIRVALDVEDHPVRTKLNKGERHRERAQWMGAVVCALILDSWLDRS